MPYDINSGSEGAALNDWLEDGRTYEDDVREQQAREIAKLQRLKLYETAKTAKTGTTCTCPSCGSPFTKKSYQQAFCSNKGRNNCKDSFWNRASSERAMRAAAFSGGY